MEKRAAAPTRRASFKELLVFAVVFAIPAVATGYLAYYVAPQVVTDWSVRDKVVAVRGASVHGKCSTQVVVRMCDATLTDRSGGTTASRDQHIVFVGLPGSGATVRVLADPERPAVLTTDLALDHLWNRTLTLLVGLVFFGGWAALMGFVLARVLVDLVRGPKGRAAAG